jgi:hypothetical protein|tara:strand:+ start:1374 stop:1616 length:243 start_codon:yes stop_codon:yes gene_type:complete
MMMLPQYEIMNMSESRRDDPRDTADGWDAGWENAVDEGEGFEEFILAADDTEFSSERGFYKRDFDHELLGKNEPEDPYLS